MKKLEFKNNRENYYIMSRTPTLNITTEGIFIKLCRLIDKNNDYKVTTSKSELAKFFHIGKVALDTYLMELIENNMVKMVINNGKTTDFFINSKYITIYKDNLKINPSLTSREKFSNDEICTFGVYLLYDINYNLIYIGKSKDIKKRIISHKKDNVEWKKLIKYYKTIKFNTEADMHLYEIYYINKFKPIYNKDAKGNDCLTVSLPDMEESIFKEWT